MNYEQEERPENGDEQKPQFDPAAETKQKILFFAVAIVVIIVLKLALGL